ncbi:Sugar transferase involved in LPS biosynthesis (colanic, teichoic acid) [Chitinophaga sp. CF118]|uniref:sugar transferase n=1 Tax=Chitinophaga sp. CF118 TaxID=1884367 RepID=UPI0008EA5C60|nr:sugar transferase [Chitinophaga sp. CF118]SFE93064.1 Sugar transferase involved in LPS biosynthesis (colanic, teichoic acid) [Chitinophaga sp. CF118]
MISHLPLNLPKERKKPEMKVISLSSCAVKRYKLCIGNEPYFDWLAKESDEYIFILKDVALSKNVLREQLYNGVTPTYIIFSVDQRLSGLKEFKRFLRSSALLEQVPLFVYTDDITAEIKQRLCKIGGIDDIITQATPKDVFEEKLKIAKSIREMSRAASTKKGRVYRPGHYINHSFKRTLDISLAGTALLLLSPLFAIIAIMIKLGSQGPVFYISHRAGTRYRIFKFYKFRTMIVDADKQVAEMTHLNQYDANASGPVFFKVTDDPRVTRLGSFLRNTSLDEIPQLFNVILGDMSLVGNRPLPLYEAATLTTDDFAGRFMAPAGITGLWQIKKRGNKDMSVKERISLDIDYAEKHSILYDIWILANTPGAMRQKNNV